MKQIILTLQNRHMVTYGKKMVFAMTLFMLCCFRQCFVCAQSTKILKAKQNSETKLWGYENVGDKSYWWKEAHSQGVKEDLLNYGYETEWVISPQYDKVGKKFSENLVGVEINGKVGFVDVRNRFVIYPQFQPVNKLVGFKFGLAAVKKNGKYGFVNKKGEFVIEPTFDYAENYDDDMLATVKMGKKFGAIDLKGDTIVPCHHITEETMKLLPFKNKEYRNAVKVVQARNNEGYYDEVKQAVNKVADEISALLSDTTYIPTFAKPIMVAYDDKKGMKYSETDTTWILRPLYTNIIPISKELYLIEQEKRQGVADAYGRILLPCNFQSVKYQPAEDIFIVSLNSSNARVGLYNRLGGMILPCVMRSISDFHDGYATAEIEDVSISIDRNGQVSNNDIDKLLGQGEGKSSDYFYRIIGLRPTCGQAHNNIGIYNLEKEWYKEGMARLEMAHTLCPSDKMIAENLKKAKADRKERRYNRIMNVLNVAGTVVDVAATTYSTVTGTPVSTTGSDSSFSSLSTSDTSSSSFSNNGNSSNSHSGNSNNLNKCKYCAGSGTCSPSSANRKKGCSGSGLCGYCHGTGWLDMLNKSRCTACNGTKYDRETGKTIGDGKCRTCKGTGKCSHCNGTGKG